MQDKGLTQNALIRANFGLDPAKLSVDEYAMAYCEAIWLEEFRLRNQAELLAAMFGKGKKND